MKIKILAFASARDALGFGEKEVEIKEKTTPKELLSHLDPACFEKLTPSRVAINHEYAEWDTPLTGDCELAILPPVSGG